MNFLLLGIDSLIACIAIGALVERRTRVRLAALFAAADAVVIPGSAPASAGAPLGGRVRRHREGDAPSSSGSTCWSSRPRRGRLTTRWAVWALPFVLTVDNLAYGLAGEQTGPLAGEAPAQALSPPSSPTWACSPPPGSHACFRQGRGPADRRGNAAGRERVRSSLWRLKESQAVELAAALMRAASSTSMRTP